MQQNNETNTAANSKGAKPSPVTVPKLKGLTTTQKKSTGNITERKSGNSARRLTELKVPQTKR